MSEENKKVDNQKTEEEAVDNNQEVKEEISEESKKETDKASGKKEKKEKKADKKESKEEILKKENESLLDMLKRERADFENYKKRNATLSAQSYAGGMFDAIEKMLPVLDNFERAMAVCDENDPFVKGMVMIQKQFIEALTSMGLSEIEAEGKAFDPELMNAVMQVERQEGQEANTVAEVLQKGYKFGDKILRHAMVKVTN